MPNAITDGPAPDSSLIIDETIKRLYDHDSPLSITQPFESSPEEISLPAAIRSTGKHWLSPYRHTGKAAKAILAFGLALAGTIAAAVFQEPVSVAPGRSSLHVSPPEMAPAAGPSLLLIAFCTLLVVLFAEVEGEKTGKEKDWQDKATAMLVALVGTVLVAVLKTPIDAAADGEGGPPNYVILMLVLESMLFFSLSDGFAHHDDDA
jgi:hypothetical protein